MAVMNESSTANAAQIRCQGCGREFARHGHVEVIGYVTTFECPCCCGTGMATIVERLLASN